MCQQCGLHVQEFCILSRRPQSVSNQPSACQRGSSHCRVEHVRSVLAWVVLLCAVITVRHCSQSCFSACSLTVCSNHCNIRHCSQSCFCACSLTVCSNHCNIRHCSQSCFCACSLTVCSNYCTCHIVFSSGSMLSACLVRSNDCKTLQPVVFLLFCRCAVMVVRYCSKVFFCACLFVYSNGCKGYEPLSITVIWLHGVQSTAMGNHGPWSHRRATDRVM